MNSRYKQVLSFHAAQGHEIIQGAIAVRGMQILHVHSRQDSLELITQSSSQFTSSMRTQHCVWLRHKFLIWLRELRVTGFLSPK